MIFNRERGFKPELRKRLIPEQRSERDRTELVDYLREVDFDLLESIYQNIAERCGVHEPVNFVRRERVVDADLSGHSRKAAGYEFTNTGQHIKREDGDVIALDGEALLSAAGEFDLSKEDFIVHTLIHEETHAVSAHREERKGWFGHISPTALQSGFEQIKVSPREGPRFFFNMLNEGAIEKLAREVNHLYVESLYQGDSGVVSSVDEAIAAEGKISNFDSFVQLVDALVAAISHESGVEETAVWQGMVRGLLEGQDLFDPVIQESLSEYISPEFFDALSKATATKSGPAKAKELIQQILEKLPQEKRAHLLSE